MQEDVGWDRRRLERTRLIGVTLGSHLGFGWNGHRLFEDPDTVSVLEGEVDEMYIHRFEEEVLDPEAAHLAVPLPDPLEQLPVALHIADIDLGELVLEFSCVHTQLDKPFPGSIRGPLAQSFHDDPDPTPVRALPSTAT